MTNSFSTPLARRKSVSNAEMNTLKAGTKEQSNSATMSKGKNFLLNMKFGSGSHSNKTNNNSEGHPSTSGVTKNSNNIAVPDKDKDKTIQVDNNKEEGNHSNKGGDNEESVYLRNWKNVPYIDVPNSQSGNETPGRYDDSNGGCVFIDSDSSAVDAIDAADALIIRSPRLEGQMSLSNDDSGGVIIITVGSKCRGSREADRNASRTPFESSDPRQELAEERVDADEIHEQGKARERGGTEMRMKTLLLYIITLR
eukprot:CAMPEP_0175041962 /NCGR_PEP_ID=MMETSP0052_2-20121109/2254_1 /TAXON_ID=51329 ORGANISM="Polytomella parva, Strain SAG 63-3" /NCGR_SAMPLE_ID=MMETSP0052_2 /ASSEMBLY_ACC=CAM_ASM_000194 /LENGTH=253 /DNA_ID=CAMNT_0016304631 /DNA_START=28 /DNA_END=787 /DNA_ORIENTATION=+